MTLRGRLMEADLRVVRPMFSLRHRQQARDLVTGMGGSEGSAPLTATLT